MNNKKHKYSKKTNRQSNVNNLQNDDDDDTKTLENITDSQLSQVARDGAKGESVHDETDDVILQVDEQKQTEIPAPKKPKRSKGKKKQDKGDESEKCHVADNVVIMDTTDVDRDLPEVIPVRKKKNKKKVSESGGENLPLQEHKFDGIQLEEKIKTECEIDKTSVNLPNIEVIDEVKIRKKKNKKKKNRNDSEKSDKSVEIISCTSVFQKLLDSDDLDVDKPNDDLELTSQDNNNSLITGEEVSVSIKSEEVSEKIEVLNPVIELGTPIQDTHKSESSQNFQSNEKEEILQSSETIQPLENKRNDSEKQSIEETADINIANDELINDYVENRESSSVKDDIIKCKAKIAKPVDKKRKNREEFQLKSTTEHAPLHNLDSQNPSTEEATIEIVVENKLKHDIETHHITTTVEQDTIDTQDSSYRVTSKERQKSSIISDVPKTIPGVREQTSSREDIKNSNDEISQDMIKDELIFESLVPSDFVSKSSEDKLNEILHTISEPKENKEFNKKDSKQLLGKNEKPRRKGKKTPKILVNPDLFTVNTEITKETENIKTSETDDKNSTSTPSDDIEIRSIKADESEGSTCDVTPEVLHPRSTSEHIRDNNNNTVIQEIFEDTFNVSLLSQNIPLIQGSGETPTETPEEISSGIKLVEIDNIPAKLEEKTDIKSKMMEVNKDMEELRCSIEKSLAELSVLDKNKEISVGEFKETQIDYKNILKTSNIITQNIISEDTALDANISQYKHAVDDVTVSIDSVAISEDNKISSVFHDEQKSSVPVDPINLDTNEQEVKFDETTSKHEQIKQSSSEAIPPICPARKDHKRGKKKKGRQEVSQAVNTLQSHSSDISSQGGKKEEKSQQNTNKETSQQKGEEQSRTNESDKTKVIEDDLNPDRESTANNEVDYEPIENFEDALTSSADDINKTFEMIVNQMTDNSQKDTVFHNPEINIIAPTDEAEIKDVKENPVTPPKNLLGHPNIPVRSNKTDYKKEKDKLPNTKQAKVKIKNNVEIEMNKETKESQTEKRREEKRLKQLRDEEYFCQISNCDDFVYKYSFRRVFLQSACHVCKNELIRFRVPCKFCSLVFYCSLKHKDEDWPKHQALCFAVSTIVHIKDQKHIYVDAKNITGHNYRLLRMQAILACEKMLKRRLVPWEQEVLLYPRMCAEVTCREWRQSKLKDCEGCGQISYCSANADHLPKSHQRWCKSYSLYQKLVIYQQTRGRLEPKLPSRVVKDYQMPEKINEVFASMFEEKIDFNDVQYAALTQIATAPLTVAFCHQIYRSEKKKNYAVSEMNKMSTFIIHVVGAELQFEADVLNKWEIFFLHLRPDVKDLRVVLISPDLNPGKLPLDLLGRIRLCENCCKSKRRVVFSFQDKKTYNDYRNGDDFTYPDIVCAFNPNFHRSLIYDGKDPWASTINAVMKLKSPFIITSHTITELQRDLVTLKEFSELEVLVEPRPNPFSSVRPDRNFISDDEVPLLFKNHCLMMLEGL